MKAKKRINFISDWLAVIGIFISIWVLFYPKPFDVLLGLLLVVSLLEIILGAFISPTTEKENDDEKRWRYDMLGGINIQAIAILVGAIRNYECGDYGRLLLVSIVVFIMMLALIFFTKHQFIKKPIKNKWKNYFWVIFFTFVYSFGAAYAINCTYDYSQPKIHTTEVLRKTIYIRGKSFGDRHYIEVVPWIRNHKMEMIKIPREEYAKLHVGDKVNFALKKGFFNIDWYYYEGK